MQIEATDTAAQYQARDPLALSPNIGSSSAPAAAGGSVAGISAVLRLPLGVARILVADVAAEGLVQVHQTDHKEGRPDLNLLERVLSGLRRL